MISINGLRKSFGGRTLFEDVSLRMGSRDRLGLVGANGTGKTTLLRLIEGTETADGGEIVRTRGLRIGVLEQDIDPAEGTTVLEYVLSRSPSLAALEEEMAGVESGLAASNDPAETEDLAGLLGSLHERYEALGGWEREHRGRAALTGLGFPPKGLDQEAAALSGGWRMRAGLAGLLVSLPDLLLLDEPTNHLDLESVVWLESFLQSFPGAVLLISHDRRLLNTLTRRTALLENGRIEVYEGNFDRFLALKEERDRLLEARARNQERKVAQAELFIECFRAKATKARQVQSRIRRLEKMERVELAPEAPTVSVRFPDPPRSGRTVLSLRGVSKSYGDLAVYRSLDLTLERGDRVALAGPNGAGKSTLLKMMAGVLPPDEGDVTPGHNVRRAYFSQHAADSLRSGRTVLQEASDAAGIMPESRLRALLGRLLFTGDDVHKKIEVLSGGEKSRVALARLLLRPGNLLLLDEPTNHLDMTSREVLAGALEEFPGTIAFITHDRDLIDRVASKVFEVGGLTVRVHLGNYSDYLARKRGLVDKVSDASRGPEQGAERPLPRGKERRAALARMRDEYREKTAPLKKRIAELEKDIEGEESRKADLERLMADPEFYGTVDFGDRLREFKQLTDRIERLHGRWESASLDLEAVEAKLDRKYAHLRGEG